MNRRGHKGRVDQNHGEIRDALRKLGAEVWSTAPLGDGFADLIACFRGVLVLLEVKQPGEKLTRAEEAFAARWPVVTVETPEAAVLAVVEAARPVTAEGPQSGGSR